MSTRAMIAGDFRQVLPVVPKGTRAAIVSASIKRHSLWQHVHKMELIVNMRVQRLLQELGVEAAAQQQQWAGMLLEVGAGMHGSQFRVPDDMVVKLPNDPSTPSEDAADLVNDVFGDLADLKAHPQDMIARCILCPKNDMVQEINELVTEQFPGEAQEYFSADMTRPEEEALYPIEFLNTLNPQGLPQHKLTLKIGQPIILLRNMDFKQGLANGTRLIIIHMETRIIKARVMSGSAEHIGKEVLIPRITLEPSENAELPVTFRRKQFPIRSAFAMSINKAQGQTFKRVGIYLPKSVFSHGQLYVAMSRVGQASGVRFMVLKGGRDGQVGTFTDNVVYKEIFQDHIV